MKVKFYIAIKNKQNGILLYEREVRIIKINKQNKWCIETVRDFINMNSECLLLSESYKNSKEKLLIECKCGNHFNTSFEKFRLRDKRQCNSCSGITNWNIDTVKNFIESTSSSGCLLLSDKYKNMYTQLTLKCSCGKVYETNFTTFKNKKAYQCPSCGKQKSIDSRRLDYTQVKDTIESSGSGCLLISQEYKNNSTPLEIKCKCGSVFKTTLANFIHQNNQSCGVCRGKFHWDISSVKEYVERNTNCTLITEQYINIDTPMEFTCECGELFTTTFSAFRHSNKTACDKCSFIMSKSESAIVKHLKSKNIHFIKEYRFEDCRNELPLPFDFAILDKNGCVICLIEADGQQHFRPINFGGISDDVAKKRYEQTCNNDNIKNEYCKENNIHLIRVPYWEFDDIKNILDSTLSHCSVDSNFAIAI